MKRSLLQTMDIVEVTRAGVQHVLLPGQCGLYYNANGYCYKSSVAGVWVYSAIQLSTQSQFLAPAKTLETVGTHNVAGHYMQHITGQNDIILSRPGGLSLYYSPSARSIMSKTGLWTGADVEVRRPLTKADFEAVQAVSLDASVVPPTGAPCLFVESNKHTDSILGAQHAVPMYCVHKNAQVQMHPVAIPPALRSLATLKDRHKTWQHVMWSAAEILRTEDFYIGWLPDVSCTVPTDRTYTRAEYNATFSTPGADPTRLLFEWDDVPPDTDITRHVDVLRAAWDVLSVTGYIPSSGIASVL